MKPSQLLDAAARQRIVAAVAEAEQGTSGEIVVAVVHACDEYGAAGWRLGAVLAVLVFLGLSLFAPPLPTTVYLLAQIAAVGIAHAAARNDALRRMLVSEAMMEACVQRRAAAAFAELDLRHTENKTGILIFIALFEHRVVVLADKGIDDALEPGESWEEVVALALDGIARGEASEGIVAAVRRCGAILAHPLPARAGDRDEIHHALVIEDAPR